MKPPIKGKWGQVDSIPACPCPVKVLDLFSGIGGFALAGKWVWGDALEIVGFCEIDDYCEKVLNKNFPGVKVHKDIKELNGKQFEEIDIITGGFPCQDISIAGSGVGLEGDRSGLWSEMFRIISEVRPGFALIENVPMLTIRGGVRVISDLAKIGYDAEWQIISAKSVGAWHKRDRIWIVAYPNGTQQQGRKLSLGRFEEYTNIGKSGWWEVEPELDRVANGIPNGSHRLKGLGNAIVPQVAQIILERIKQVL